jgi:uncharacterized protein YjbI with pentapeptide repeats
MRLLREKTSSGPRAAQRRQRAAQRRQRAAQRQWWHIVVILFLALLFIMFVTVVSIISVLGYLHQWKWTGVTGKTFWHWLGLLFAPVLLSGGGFLLYTLWAWSEHRDKEKAANEAARHADLDKITQGYLNDIQKLLLEADSKEGKLVNALARARTLNVVEGLDQYRKGSIIRFLNDASLLTQSKNNDQESSQQLFIILKGANLREAHLRRIYLSHAKLSGADLSYANLEHANLEHANLSSADLGGADLSYAKLSHAKLSHAKISQANLERADLKKANLQYADLKKANLQYADLSHANLTEAYLGGANLSGASGVTKAQLVNQAASLQNATMPDRKALKDVTGGDAPTHSEWLNKFQKDRWEDGENGDAS